MSESVYILPGGIYGTADLKKVYRDLHAQQKKTTSIIDRVYSRANDILKALQAVGVPSPASSYGVYATYHETAAYTNNGATKWNNYSGIKYAGQKGAKKGPNGYAVFDSINDWARSYKHEITKKSNPAGAGSLEEFATRLKQNGYFEAPLSEYIAGMKRARYVLKSLPATQRASVQPDGSTQDRQDLDIPSSKDYADRGFLDWWNGLATWKKVGGAVGAGLVVLAIIKK